MKQTLALLCFLLVSICLLFPVVSSSSSTSDDDCSHYQSCFDCTSATLSGCSWCSAHEAGSTQLGACLTAREKCSAVSTGEAAQCLIPTSCSALTSSGCDKCLAAAATSPSATNPCLWLPAFASSTATPFCLPAIISERSLVPSQSELQSTCTSSSDSSSRTSAGSVALAVCFTLMVLPALYLLIVHGCFHVSSEYSWKQKLFGIDCSPLMLSRLFHWQRKQDDGFGGHGAIMVTEADEASAAAEEKEKAQQAAESRRALAASSGRRNGVGSSSLNESKDDITLVLSDENPPEEDDDDDEEKQKGFVAIASDEMMISDTTSTKKAKRVKKKPKKQNGAVETELVSLRDASISPSSSGEESPIAADASSLPPSLRRFFDCSVFCRDYYDGQEALPRPLSYSYLPAIRCPLPVYQVIVILDGLSVLLTAIVLAVDRWYYTPRAGTAVELSMFSSEVVWGALTIRYGESGGISGPPLQSFHCVASGEDDVADPMSRSSFGYCELVRISGIFLYIFGLVYFILLSLRFYAALYLSLRNVALNADASLRSQRARSLRQMRDAALMSARRQVAENMLQQAGVNLQLSVLEGSLQGFGCCGLHAWIIRHFLHIRFARFYLTGAALFPLMTFRFVIIRNLMADRFQALSDNSDADSLRLTIHVGSFLLFFLCIFELLCWALERGKIEAIRLVIEEEDEAAERRRRGLHEDDSLDPNAERGATAQARLGRHLQLPPSQLLEEYLAESARLSTMAPDERVDLNRDADFVGETGAEMKEGQEEEEHWFLSEEEAKRQEYAAKQADAASVMTTAQSSEDQVKSGASLTHRRRASGESKPSDDRSGDTFVAPTSSYSMLSSTISTFSSYVAPTSSFTAYPSVTAAPLAVTHTPFSPPATSAGFSTYTESELERKLEDHTSYQPDDAELSSSDNEEAAGLQ